MRRTARQMRLGRFLRLGQHWRWRYDRSIWTVEQIYRRDCVVALRCGDARLIVPFDHLRTDWKWIAPAYRLEEAA